MKIFLYFCKKVEKTFPLFAKAYLDRIFKSFYNFCRNTEGERDKLEHGTENAIYEKIFMIFFVEGGFFIVTKILICQTSQKKFHQPLSNPIEPCL